MINLKESQYFNSLPKMIQESIIQSGIQFDTEDEIRKFVTNLEKNQ